MMNSSRIIVAMALAVGISLLTGQSAMAQPGGSPPPVPYPGYYYPAAPPAPPPVYRPQFHGRRGLTIGVGVGAGNMAAKNTSLECSDCDYNPVAVGGEVHVGYMVNPRLALILELSGTAKTLDASGSQTLTQYMGFLAAQYWVTERLWLKGGIGGAQLALQIDDGVFVSEESVGSGGSLLGAIGYEIVAGPRFALDLQLRLTSAAYEGKVNDSIDTGVFGLGLDWY